jgi:hypothetical protein
LSTQPEGPINRTEGHSRLSFGPYVYPFAVFALFTIAASVTPLPKGLVYPLKTILTAICLVWAWKGFKEEIHFRFSGTAVLAGILVVVLWIALDPLYPHIGGSEFNPYQEAQGSAVYLVIAFRLAGASLVVPVMEEVFWRSFALRFIVRADFQSIPLGQFSWYSFIVITLLFGFEHHRWLAGILAGAVYAALLYRSKNLFDPILSHAVTNFLLGIYVLSTQNWSFW